MVEARAPDYGMVIVVDARFAGGTAQSVAREVAALNEAGWTVGLLDITPDPDVPLPPSLGALIAGGGLRPIGSMAGPVSCGILVAHNPLAFETRLPPGPEIRADLAVAVAHQAPLDGTGKRLVYDPMLVQDRLLDRFGSRFLWAAISERCRSNLYACGCPVPVLEALWLTVLEPGPWHGPRAAPLHDRVRIGRHSRADRLKWPSRPSELRTMFPDRADWTVRLMGMPEGVRRSLAPVPHNWEILPPNAEPVPVFLESIDFFVYFHHDDLFETYGLTVVEALASGAVVILPPHFRENFGPAPVYCAPEEVVGWVERLFADPQAFAVRSERGCRWVRERHAPASRVDALKATLRAARTGALGYSTVAATAAGRRRRLRLWGRRRLRDLASLLRRLPFGAALISRIKGESDA